jgi:hypothetical protein
MEISKSTSCKVTEEDMKYIPRNGQTSFDFPNLQMTGNWETLDLSGIIGSATKQRQLLVRLQINIFSNPDGHSGYVRLANNTNAVDGNLNQIVWNSMFLAGYVGELDIYAVLDIGTDTTIKQKSFCSGTLSFMANLEIFGYFET